MKLLCNFHFLPVFSPARWDRFALPSTFLYAEVNQVIKACLSWLRPQRFDLIGNHHNIPTFGRPIFKHIVIAIPVVGPIDQLARKQAVFIVFTGTGSGLAFE